MRKPFHTDDTEEQQYEEEFHQPEAFLPLGRRLMVIPVPDESVQNDAEKAVNKPPVEHDR